jgi:hypothetical protein
MSLQSRLRQEGGAATPTEYPKYPAQFLSAVRLIQASMFVGSNDIAPLLPSDPAE